MKFTPILMLASLASLSNALAPTTSRSDSSRRAFISKVTSATAATAATAVGANAIFQPAPAFAKDEYSFDVGDNVVVPVKEKKEKGNGAGIVGGALGASVLLSLPFFLPNLLRLAGVNNVKEKK
mmetsp:Transcript_17911/g.20416  ORF Transcript_17911/g.20416 Transcript_17911/m.20416 type:complete len:124 (+) Transcript_17911:108-479(+)